MRLFALDDHKAKASGGTATEVLEIGPVPQDLVWEIQHVAVEDETSDFTAVRIGPAEANGFRPLLEFRPGVAGELYASEEPIYVTSGRFIRAEFSGTTSGDKLALRINGHQLPEGWPSA